MSARRKLRHPELFAGPIVGAQFLNVLADAVVNQCDKCDDLARIGIYHEGTTAIKAWLCHVHAEPEVIRSMKQRAGL